MAVKHIPTGIVHQGNKGGKTGCGFNTNEQSSHWEQSSQRISCGKNSLRPFALRLEPDKLALSLQLRGLCRLKRPRDRRH